jgi:hypothetical protein
VSQPAAKISIYRQDDIRLDRYATYEVVIDNVVVGGIIAGGKETFSVATGRHRVRMRYAWLGSNTVFVTAGPDQEIELLCSSSPWPGKLVNGLFGWNRYLLLRQLVPGSHKVAPAKRVRARRVAREVVPGLLGT